MRVKMRFKNAFLKCFLNGVNNTQERMAIGKGQDECARSSQE